MAFCAILVQKRLYVAHKVGDFSAFYAGYWRKLVGGAAQGF